MEHFLNNCCITGSVQGVREPKKSKTWSSLGRITNSTPSLWSGLGKFGGGLTQRQIQQTKEGRMAWRTGRKEAAGLPVTNQYCIYLSSELLLHFILTSSGKCCVLYKNVRNIQRIVGCILVADTKGTWKFHLFSVREMDGQTVTKLSLFLFCH